jgi:hypothetical protein
MRIQVNLFICLLITILFGCTQNPPIIYADRIPFPETEYKKLQAKGVSTVKGQAFLRTRGGDVKTAAGSTVILDPVTTYSKQWYELTYLGGVFLKEPDPLLAKYIRSQVADGEGRFTFKDIPAGDYFLTATVTWEAPSAYQLQGGIVSNGQSISVKDGEDIEVVLSKVGARHVDNTVRDNDPIGNWLFKPRQ